ncbi:hypothetical protein L9F63_022045 [Diploptera punctata]|uniref:Uncharacterized protein n=1 Tax=Diploptera punctata TaxID=6984 RepID=A0AAD8EB67_DIPPU|nr:hypothetical protein L9F63_022045 [Diploptera punctata]
MMQRVLLVSLCLTIFIVAVTSRADHDTSTQPEENKISNRRIRNPETSYMRFIIPKQLLKYVMNSLKKVGPKLRKRLSPVPIPKTPKRPRVPPGRPGQPRPNIEPEPRPIQPPLPYPNIPRRRSPPQPKPFPGPRRPFFDRART